MSLATPTQVATLIRSALADLDGLNAHHEFEHLCRQLAMRRVATNVLPATGPVSAGGDQGRDFETYRSRPHERAHSCSSTASLILHLTPRLADGEAIRKCMLTPAQFNFPS